MIRSQVFRMPSSRLAGFVSMLAATVLALAFLSGCACFNKDNVPTLNFVEKHLVPESTTGQIVASPVLFPAGLVALGVDIAIVHPAMVIPDAATDTKDALWDDLDWDKMYVTECAALPWRTVFTPVLFSGDFLGRAFFDVAGKAKHTEELEKARKLVEEEKYSEAKPLLKGSWKYNMPNKQRQEAMFLELKVLCLTGDYQAMNDWDVHELMKSDRKQEVLALLDTCRKSEKPLVRWTAYQGLLQGYAKEAEGQRRVFRELMAEEDPVLRAMGLGFVGARGSVFAALIPDLKRVAEEDGSPTNRALAAYIAEHLGK